MAEAVINMNLMKPKEEVLDEQIKRMEVLDALEDVQDRLETAFTVFNQVSDSELIDSCIYEINALQAKYTYFLNCARIEGIERGPVFKARRRFEW